MQADYVDAGGTRVFVRSWGDDRYPVVFYWHGGGGGSNEWPHFAPALEAAGYAVYAPDAPGYGESQPVELRGRKWRANTGPSPGVAPAMRRTSSGG